MTHHVFAYHQTIGDINDFTIEDDDRIIVTKDFIRWLDEIKRQPDENGRNARQFIRKLHYFHENSQLFIKDVSVDLTYITLLRSCIRILEGHRKVMLYTDNPEIHAIAETLTIPCFKKHTA